MHCVKQIFTPNTTLASGHWKVCEMWRLNEESKWQL